jgi:hypothetical protein
MWCFAVRPFCDQDEQSACAVLGTTAALHMYSTLAPTYWDVVWTCCTLLLDPAPHLASTPCQAAVLSHMEAPPPPPLKSCKQPQNSTDRLKDSAMLCISAAAGACCHAAGILHIALTEPHPAALNKLVATQQQWANLETPLPCTLCHTIRWKVTATSSRTQQGCWLRWNDTTLARCYQPLG